MNTQTPAWPHRPPVGTTLAMLASVALGCLYCRTTVQLMQSPRRDLLPLYVESRIRRALPMPAFGRGRRAEHRFILPDHSSVTVAPGLLYQFLRENVFGGESIPALFVRPAVAFALTFVVLVTFGTCWDRDYIARSRAGRLIRGPRIVSAAQYDRATKGEGLRFKLR